MRRIISVWLPSLALDRLRRAPATPGCPARSRLLRRADAPVACPAADAPPLVLRCGEVVTAADEAALALGLGAGTPLARARALVPGLRVRDADPAGDAEALRRLAAWCLRWTSLVVPDGADGVWLDATRGAVRGPARPGGARPEADEARGEAALLADIARAFEAEGLSVRLAIADTPGAAHALARHGAGRLLLAPPGRGEAMLGSLPVAALRLDAGVVEGLRRLGLDRVGPLLAAPRAPLARRFGPELGLRLDQLTGRGPESVRPLRAPRAAQARLDLPVPLRECAALSALVGRRLVPTVCAALERAGQGALRLELLLVGVGGTTRTLAVSLARPCRDPARLSRRLEERLLAGGAAVRTEAVEALRLLASVTEALAVPLTGDGGAAPAAASDAVAPDVAPDGVGPDGMGPKGGGQDAASPGGVFPHGVRPDAVPGDATPGDATPGNATSRDAAPGNATPGDAGGPGRRARGRAARERRARPSARSRLGGALAAPPRRPRGTRPLARSPWPAPPRVP